MSDFKGHKFFDGIADLQDYLRTKVSGISGDAEIIPYLQSDYTIVVFDDSETTNASDYTPIMVQSLDLSPLRNGFTSSMDIWGLQSVNFSASNALTFSYLGVPFTYNNPSDIDNGFYGDGKTYTSIIHYYYARRFANNGTLRIKLKGDKLPSVMIVNTKSNNIVYALYNCTFSYPTFEASPQNNNIAFYKTTVTYSSYKEYLGDNLIAYFEHNNGQLANMEVVNQDVIETSGNVGKVDVGGKSMNELQEIFKLAQQAAKL